MGVAGAGVGASGACAAGAWGGTADAAALEVADDGGDCARAAMPDKASTSAKSTANLRWIFECTTPPFSQE